MKKIINIVDFTEYIIAFEYETWKGHRREQHRSLKAINKDHAKELFKNWSNKQRAMTNVKILGIAKTKNTEKFEI